MKLICTLDKMMYDWHWELRANVVHILSFGNEPTKAKAIQACLTYWYNFRDLAPTFESDD